MKRVYAYLMKKRYIDREILSFLQGREHYMSPQSITTQYLPGWIRRGTSATSIKKEPVPMAGASA